MRYRNILALGVIFFFSFFLPVLCDAQTTFGFTYDASGNRVKREVITLKSATIPGDSLSANLNNKVMEEEIGSQEIRIYPNPTKGMIRIDLPPLNNQEATIQIHDAQGKQIIRQVVLGSANINLFDYPSGFYIMIIRIGQEKKEWKIIKE